MKGCESPGHIRSRDCRIIVSADFENVYVDHTFTMIVIEKEVFILMIFQNVNQARPELILAKNEL